LEVLIVHIPDGFLNNNLAEGLLVGALGILGYCLNKVCRTAIVFIGTLAGNSNNGSIQTPMLGFSSEARIYFQKLALIAIWVFAFEMFNIPVKSATSAHLIGGVFASVLAGPFAGFLIMSSVLIVQSLFFCDGGILAIGANILNMSFVGSFISYYVYKAFSCKNYYFAVFAACLFSVLVAAFCCLIELAVSGLVSFAQAFKDMMSLHLIVALLETIITLVLLKVFKNLIGCENE
jgi:cobalt/nickel transport system permease protein